MSKRRLIRHSPGVLVALLMMASLVPVANAQLPTTCGAGTGCCTGACGAHAGRLRPRDRRQARMRRVMAAAAYLSYARAWGTPSVDVGIIACCMGRP